MTRRSFVSLLAVVLASLAAPVAAQNARIAVSIPYEFTAGNRKLAAGQYTISRPVPSDPRVLAFRGDAKHQKALVTTSRTAGEEMASDTELVFARYGDLYFLRSIHIRGIRERHEVPISKAEKAVAAKSAAVMVRLKAEQ